MAVVDVEELAKKQGLKPNLQLFAEECNEIVLPKVSTYEQARNKVFEYIGDSLSNDSEAFYDRLESSKGFNKIVGRRSLDKKLRRRLDYDPVKGPHIHIEDFRNGKGSLSKKVVVPFNGDEKTFSSLLEHLNR